MKKLVFILSAMLLLIGTMDVQAQWGKKLLKKAGESAKRATESGTDRRQGFRGSGGCGDGERE